jgi:hypothetical protein
MMYFNNTVILSLHIWTLLMFHNEHLELKELNNSKYNAYVVHFSG